MAGKIKIIFLNYNKIQIYKYTRDSNFGLRKISPWRLREFRSCSGLAYSLNEREASDSNWSVGWDKHDSNLSVAQTHKQTYIYTYTRNIYIDGVADHQIGFFFPKPCKSSKL